MLTTSWVTAAIALVTAAGAAVTIETMHGYADERLAARASLAEVDALLSQASSFHSDAGTGHDMTVEMIQEQNALRGAQIWLLEARSKLLASEQGRKLVAELGQLIRIVDRQLYFVQESQFGLAARSGSHAAPLYKAASRHVQVLLQAFQDEAHRAHLLAELGSYLALISAGVVNAYLWVANGRARRRAIQLEEARSAALHRIGDIRRNVLGRVLDASEAERTRLATDLHDGPIQRLTALDFKLDVAARKLDGADARAASTSIADVQEGLRREIGGLRRVMAELRPPVLEQSGLAEAVGAAASSVLAGKGVLWQLDSSLGSRLDPRVETVLYRVAQEAFANIDKHARATQAWARLGRVDGHVALEIGDDGVGFEPSEAERDAGLTHYGLAGMRERVEMAGGELSIESAPGRGTTIQVLVPEDIRVPEEAPV